MLAAGLDGIRRKLTPPRPVEENLYHFDDQMMAKYAVGTLPGTLKEALDELEADEVIREALGEHIFEWFLRNKRREWAGYKSQVTPFEIDRYLRTL